MAAQTQFKQCTLERSYGANSKVTYVAWIPTQYAKKGKTVSIKDGNDDWVPWLVVSVGSAIRTVEEMDLQRDAQKRWESVLK